MKKIVTILIILITTLTFIPKVFAENSITTNKTDVKVGETFEITVNLDNVASWEINVASTDNANNCTITENGSTLDGENANKSFNTICTATAEGIIRVTLSGSVVTASNEDDIDDTTISLAEEIQINVTKEVEPKGLSILQVTRGSLSPIFNSDNIENTGYTITLDSPETTSFSINAVPKTATDRINPTRYNGSSYEAIYLDNIAFTTSGNNNTMSIEIAVGEGERLVTYRITVVKPTRIESPELATLTIGGQNINVVSGLYEYTIELDDVSLYQINATLKDSINYRFNNFLVPPVEMSGENEIPITIEPKDATAGLETITYKITVKSSTIEPTPSVTPNNNNNSNSNPKTSTTSAYVVGLILIISLFASLYLYRKNINGYS